jgi:Domain of unknown function (DUF5668)/Cell wall-active antibiotics response 4TMS YvqF
VKQENNTTISTGKLFLGLFLILLGVVYTIDQLDFYDADEVIKYWPVILIAAGLAKFLEPGSSGGRFSGSLIGGIGVILLLGNLDIVHVDLRDLFPLALVAIGARIAWRGLKPAGNFGVTIGDSTRTVNGFAMLGGARRTNNSDDFRGGDLVAVLGGCEIDLRSARIKESPAVIDAFAMWGGVEIIVPPGWRVSMRGVPLLGAFEDKTVPAPAGEGAREELVIKGFAIMGGVEVKN